MIVYRLTRKKYLRTLSGKGAAKKGARWNSPGTELIYTAQNRSLAMAEIAVHFSISTLPSDYYMVEVEIPDSLKIKKVHISKLPKDWKEWNPYSKRTQSIGDNFVVENKFCLMQVPSAVTKGDFNILINPKHTDFKNVKIKIKTPFPFDDRIFK